MEILWARVEGSNPSSKLHALINGVFNCPRAGKYAKPKKRGRKIRNPSSKSICIQCQEVKNV